jgi:hypothetical protein
VIGPKGIKGKPTWLLLFRGESQGTACPHQSERGRLATVITPQAQCRVPRAVENLAVHGPVQGRQPVLRGAPQAGVVPHDLLRLPVQEHHDIAPQPNPLPKALGMSMPHHACGCVGRGLAAGQRPLRLQAQLGRHQQVRLSHQTPHPLFVDRQLGHQTLVGP